MICASILEELQPEIARKDRCIACPEALKVDQIQFHIPGEETRRAIKLTF